MDLIILSEEGGRNYIQPAQNLYFEKQKEEKKKPRRTKVHIWSSSNVKYRKEVQTSKIKGKKK